MSDKETLISQLIEETYSESIKKSQPSACVDLNKYFEKRLNQVEFNSINDYLDQEQLIHQSLVYNNSTKCFRLSFNELVLDFPSNWSIFKKIQYSEIIYLDHNEDSDFLLDIFSEFNKAFDSIAIVNENDDLKIVFLNDIGSTNHLGWLRNYFNKKKLNKNDEFEAA